MSIETLIRLTVYFNVSADYMLGISDLVQPEDSIKIHELVQLYRGLNERDKEELAPAGYILWETG